MSSIIEQLLQRAKPQDPHQNVRFNLSTTLDLRSHDQEPPADPDGAVRWMNTEHFVVPDGGKTVVITEGIDPELKRRALTRSSFPDLRNLYCNRYVETFDKHGKPKRVALGNYWLTSEGRRQYRGIVCAPRGDAPGYYNLWQGFSVEPRHGDWSLMEHHIESPSP